MPKPFLLALPRLHAEFCVLPRGCRTLWPGLPSPPEQSWQPVYPWHAEQAAACLTDFQRAARDGARGAPVLSLGATPPPVDLSLTERDALREFLGNPAENASLPPRIHAQKMLILAWFQEKQALELASLEAMVRGRQRALSVLISGRAGKDAPAHAPGDDDLPHWTISLTAALTFLPDMPENAVFFVNSRAMSEDLAELESGEKRACPRCDVLLFNTRDLPGVPRAALPADALQRTLTFILPR